MQSTHILKVLGALELLGFPQIRGTTDQYNPVALSATLIAQTARCQSVLKLTPVELPGNFLGSMLDR